MMTRRTAVAAFLLIAGCSADAATQLVVVVDSDLEAPARVDQVRLAVSGPSGTTTVVQEMLGDGGAELPLTLGVSPAGNALGPVTVTADGLLAGSRVVTRSARTHLVRGKTLTLYLFLPASCVGTECPDGETCTANGCAPVEIDPSDLPAWNGRVPMRDAGQRDGGLPDGAPEDAGPATCISGSECDDGIDCTHDICDGGVCSHAPDDGVCTAGPEGVCDATFGCQYADCTPTTCTAGPCQTAACDGDTCVRTNLCASGESCCAGACVPAGCSDANACTDDTCGATGCEHVNNTAACDDGLYCNGADTCAGGSCATHAGTPCSGSAVCDESADLCTGCLSDADCGAPVYGTWGACGGFADGCDQTGTRSRTVTSYRCVSGSCQPSDTTETGSCTRSTDGNTCGTTTCGSYGSCGGYASACDESGTRSRTCTDRLCASGTCTDSARTETASCSRDTDGSSCAATTCTAWGTCGGFAGACDETGTQSRTCTSYACASGSCGSTMTTETQNCTRDTDGASCDDSDPSTCGDFCNGGVCDSITYCVSPCVCNSSGTGCVDGSGGGTICMF